MALKTCEDCKNEISTMAISCPHCGRPSMNDGIVTIEKSQKKYKRLDIIGFLLFIPGVLYFLLFIAMVNNIPNLSIVYGWLWFVSIAMIATGLFILIGAGIGRWWHHG
jgi:RNA polymerase subunit RPABC4/transcription elongation factor Spt4